MKRIKVPVVKLPKPDVPDYDIKVPKKTYHVEKVNNKRIKY